MYFRMLFLSALVSFTGLQAQPSIPGEGLDCNSSAVILQGLPVHMYLLDVETGDNTVLSIDLLQDSVTTLNAAGFNPLDQHIWAHVTNSSALVRIGSDLEPEFFDVTGLPDDVVFYSGDFSGDGILYLMKSSGDSIYKINLDATSNLYLQVVDILQVDYINISDWAYNPVDGFLYSIAANYALCRFDTSTGQMTYVGEVTGADISYQGHYGAVFFDAEGSFYIVHNQSGQVFRIEAIANGETGAEWIATGPASMYNDGAMCSSNYSLVNTPDCPVPQIFPNPFDEYFIIETKGLIRYEVSDLSGRKIESVIGTNAQVETRSWPSGVYIVNCLYKGGNFTRRIIKA